MIAVAEDGSVYVTQREPGNTIGFGWHPRSKRLYGMDHGIDDLGDDDPAEEVNELTEKSRYGWPPDVSSGASHSGGST